MTASDARRDFAAGFRGFLRASPAPVTFPAIMGECCAAACACAGMALLMLVASCLGRGYGTLP